MTALGHAAESPAQRFARLPKEEREAKLRALSEAEQLALWRSWKWWGRPAQIAPEGSWRWWIVVTGRGWGKNRVGSEWVLDRCEAFAAHAAPHSIGLLNSTYTDVRNLQIEGVSGLVPCALRRGHRIDIPKSRLEGRIRVWTTDGWHDSHVEVHTADQPDRVRGRNMNTLHADELARWPRKMDAEGGTVFTNADFGLRAQAPAPGLDPQGCVTTTPKPLQVLKDLLAGEFAPNGQTVVTRGSMLENRINLSRGFMDSILLRYSGSRLGAQEIEGLLLEHVEGALWDIARCEATRLIPGRDPMPDMVSIVIGVDPSGGGPTGTTGIVVAGAGWHDGVPHMYVLEDLSEEGRPSDDAARVVVDAYHRWGANTVSVERNFGGDQFQSVIKVLDPMVSVSLVKASHGKAVRAEPVATMWAPEQHRGHLCGSFPDLESQLTTFVPGEPSPDRLDAMVWAGYALMPDLVAIDSTQAYGQTIAETRL